MEKVLVSSCLLGRKVRYNGSDLEVRNSDFDWLLRNHEVISFCPEISAGLPTPRVPAEIQNGLGEEVLSGAAKVKGNDGSDVTSEFLLGAKLALEKCISENINFAVLTESSPSCGSATIYDGNYNGHKKSGNGVTAALLEKHGVKVYSQHRVGELKHVLETVFVV